MLRTFAFECAGSCADGLSAGLLACCVSHSRNSASLLKSILSDSATNKCRSSVDELGILPELEIDIFLNTNLNRRIANQLWWCFQDWHFFGSPFSWPAMQALVRNSVRSSCLADARPNVGMTRRISGCWALLPGAKNGRERPQELFGRLKAEKVGSLPPILKYFPPGLFKVALLISPAFIVIGVSEVKYPEQTRLQKVILTFFTYTATALHL